MLYTRELPHARAITEIGSHLRVGMQNSIVFPLNLCISENARICCIPSQFRA